MAQHRTLIVACSVLIVCALVAGCNRGGGGPSSPTAAVKAAKGEGTTLSGAASSPASPKPPADPQHPVVAIETSLGTITIRLDAEKVPLTVGNFLDYVNAGFYSQTIVHQVYRGQGWVAGSHGANGLEKPARTPIRNEAATGGLKNRRGTIAMVRRPDAEDSATSQFFVNVANNENLDFKDRTAAGYGYCVFGEIIDGLEVVDKINAVEVHDTADFERIPVQPIVISSIRRIQ